MFLYNLPRWLIEYGAYLNSFPEMTFKHWIAVDKAHSLPIPNRLSPSHYGFCITSQERSRAFSTEISLEHPFRHAVIVVKTSRITVDTRSS